MSGIALTILCNPLHIMQVHKQAFHNSMTKSYSEILADVGPIRMCTLGLVPTLFRNFLLCAGYVPSFLAT
jgi:hypothetical protein